VSGENVKAHAGVAKGTGGEHEATTTQTYPGSRHFVRSVDDSMMEVVEGFPKENRLAAANAKRLEGKLEHEQRSRRLHSTLTVGQIGIRMARDDGRTTSDRAVDPYPSETVRRWLRATKG